MQNYFENKNGSIYALVDCEIILADRNVDILADGNMDCMLFGSLLIVHDPKGNSDYWTINLATRVILSIYSEDQYFKDEDGHYVISFKEGDKVIESDIVPKSIKNLEEVFETLMGGHVSPLIAYYEYYQTILNGMEANEELGVSKVLLEIIISEIFRDSATNSMPARLSDDPNEKGRAQSIRNLVIAKNTFSAMTFEDWSKSMYLSKKKSKSRQTQSTSVLEKYMKK